MHYSNYFLFSLAEGFDLATITELSKYSDSFVIAKITWDKNLDNMLPDGVNTFNLAKVPGSKTVREDGTVGTVLPNTLFCQC